ncbi:hypothetical protein QJS10_CPA10g00484 [Acorus calamus]|uniref:2Fe-2S ferredoxin-type domain-containing protein n=1 Tax=Acorus calamus TaxID=4465 RepID=A0AAV9E033_ACOCL|nr:hypothetical protein QJS10_CPA10g00484 [Acorus calamus]
MKRRSGETSSPLSLQASQSFPGWFRGFSCTTKAKACKPRYANRTTPSSQSPFPAKPAKELIRLGERVYLMVKRLSVKSGEKVLRNLMTENKIELYGAYGKVMNCGGGGSCGTCIVEIIDGMDLLNGIMNPYCLVLHCRNLNLGLACQTIVGNKENSGMVTVQLLPQWKK